MTQKRIVMSLPPKIAKGLKKIAAKKRLKVSKLVQLRIEEYLNKKTKKDK